MADGKTDSDTERASSLKGRRLSRSAQRERRDGHQVISAETVKKTKGESGRQ